MIYKLTLEMLEYFKGDAKRIQHFIKVHSFARIIGVMEHLTTEELFVVEAAALVHDIGIKPAEEKFGECGGKLQEELGPDEARPILKKIGFSQENTDRICYIIAHHHTYSDIKGRDLQIVIEADFLVNLFEESASSEAIKSAYDSIFRTLSGKKLCCDQFGMQLVTSSLNVEFV